MSIQKPGIPKGTRDFNPSEISRRDFIFSTISKTFEKYGYVRIETPALENLDTLLGKYGDEGDKLLFKILNSGDFLAGTDIADLHNKDSNRFALKISEKGLRFDLTVPFARYVVQHQHEIVFPFKRYQIQPVWRADRPQRGRYREFYQCDADVIGSTSLLNETELIQIMDEVFCRLGIKVKIKVNNRKILAAVSDYIATPDKILDITIAIDKLEKIGMDAVTEELKAKGLLPEAIANLKSIMLIKGKPAVGLDKLNHFLSGTTAGRKGIEELHTLFNCLASVQIESDVELDLALARGLNYYTGTIIEAKALDAEIGSLCGGGRYDDLTGIFGLKDISGVGISFGADRIYDVMNQLKLFPAETLLSSKILFVNFGKKEALYCLGLLKILRSEGIAGELYPDPVKLKKQLAYAHARNIQIVALVGENEISQSVITVKNMSTGEQKNLTIEELKELLICAKR